MYGECEAAKGKRVAEEAATARDKEAEVNRPRKRAFGKRKRQATVVSTREETKVENLGTRKGWLVITEVIFVTKQKYVRRVDTLGSGMEVVGEWQVSGVAWEEISRT